MAIIGGPMRVLEPDQVASWVSDELLNPSRTLPVVAVTTRARTGSTWVEPGELAAALDGLAEVVCLETGPATWELADALPERLDVYGGALRIWWPGLRPDADPHDHRLYFVHSPAEAKTVFDRIVAAVRDGDNQQAERQRRDVGVRVTASDNGRIQVIDDGGTGGELRYADVPVAALARCLEVGSELRARPVQALENGRWAFSVQGLLPKPVDRVLEELEVGDVVIGRVRNTVEYGAFVEVLPRVVGLVHISELDWSHVDSVDQFTSPGQLLPVKVVEIGRDEGKFVLSVKRALGTDPRPLPSLVPGGLPFTWDEPSSSPQPEHESALQDELDTLQDELDAAVADRRRLAEQVRELRGQVQDLRRQVRSADDRYAGLERRLAHDLDPLSSERAFLLGVRIAYARMFDEDDRIRHPLVRMRVGPAFMDSLRALDGIEVDKVLEVCAQVASGTAHEMASREVHQLRAGSRGAGTHQRASDGALAWRCALQTHTPSARRLHWWAIPGAEGGTIEFASVGVHDEFSIPE